MIFKRSQSRNTSTGTAAEDYAAAYLQNRGAQIVNRNYRTPNGEIDLICQLADQLVFVEVRLRNHRRFGSGAESVDARKQQKLVRTAALYLQKHYGDHPPPCRFDVVSLSAKADNSNEFRVDWIANAFCPE